MAQIDYVADWTKRLKSRLYTQFRHSVSWQQWATFLGDMAQDWEDAAQSLLTSLDIDASVGAQLDVIGRIVGQPRTGAVDTLYRIYLKARVLANLSTGTVENIFDVMRAMHGTDALPTYQGGLVKQFAVRIGKVIDRASAMAGVEFLHDSKEAAARGLFVWQETASASMFTFDGTATIPGLGFDVGYFAGAAQA